MQNRSSKRKTRDPNQLAASILDEATQDEAEEAVEEAPEDTSGKNPAAVALGRSAGFFE